MARSQVMVQLTDEIVDLLDREGAHRHLSRSALIREAVLTHLAEARVDLIGQAIAGGYERVPPLTPDGWGDLDAQGETSTRELLQRLDAEERAEGHGSW